MNTNVEDRSNMIAEGLRLHHANSVWLDENYKSLFQRPEAGDASYVVVDRNDPPPAEVRYFETKKALLKYLTSLADERSRASTVWKYRGADEDCCIY